MLGCPPATKLATASAMVVVTTSVVVMMMMPDFATAAGIDVVAILHRTIERGDTFLGRTAILLHRISTLRRMPTTVKSLVP